MVGVIALNLRTAPAATIIHLAIRPYPPAPEGMSTISYKPLEKSSSILNLEAEPPKKSLLPFSLPTIPRPGGSSRQNSTNVPLVSPSIPTNSTPNANANPMANAAPAGGTAATVPAAANTAANARAIRGGEDSHGGGCKCVIM